MEEKIVLRESYPGDSDSLNRFFSQIPTQGLLNIKIQRQVDFFSLYRRLKLNFHNYILEEINDKNQQPEILGTASFLEQDYTVDNKKVKISYACDLRISPQRKAILNWSQHFLPQLEELIDKTKTEHFVTSLSLSNMQAMNAFIRVKQKKTKKPFYEHIRKFNIVSIHGFYPFVFKRNPYIKVAYLTKEDQKEFLNYINAKLKNLDLVPLNIHQDIENFIQDSFMYSMKRFIIAKDSQNNIIGCCHAISSSLMQDYFPQDYNTQSNNFRQFLKLASFLKFGRTLTRPFSSTQKDQTLNFQFLHFLFFDHPEALKSMIHYAYKKSIQNEFIIYPYEPNMFNYRPPIGTIHTEMPYALYEIRTPNSIDDPHQKSLRNKLTKNIWLDGFML